MKMRTIPCVEKKVDGLLGIYPTGPLAEPFFELTGRRNITAWDAKALFAMGFLLKVIDESKAKPKRRAA